MSVSVRREISSTKSYTVITFDKNQLVSNYNISSKEKLLNIDINKNKTSKGIDKELGFWQDFLSSFARRLQDPAGNY